MADDKNKSKKPKRLTLKDLEPILNLVSADNTRVALKGKDKDWQLAKKVMEKPGLTPDQRLLLQRIIGTFGPHVTPDDVERTDTVWPYLNGQVVMPQFPGGKLKVEVDKPSDKIMRLAPEAPLEEAHVLSHEMGHLLKAKESQPVGRFTAQFDDEQMQRYKMLANQGMADYIGNALLERLAPEIETRSGTQEGGSLRQAPWSGEVGERYNLQEINLAEHLLGALEARHNRDLGLPPETERKFGQQRTYIPDSAFTSHLTRRPQDQNLTSYKPVVQPNAFVMPSPDDIMKR